MASIPMIAAGKPGSSLQNAGITNAVLGLFYTPTVCIIVGSRNRSRPIMAVQAYIDNVAPERDAITPSKPAAAASEASTAAAETSSANSSSPSKAGGNNDFLVVNSKLIVADSGTHLRSANNRQFFINGSQYPATGVTAFQIGKRYYRKFPDIKSPSDFAQRSVNGRISVFNYVEHGNSQARSNLKGNQFTLSRSAQKNTYFVKDDSESYIKGFMKLQPYFVDNPKALGIYTGYVRQTKNLKLVGYSISAVGLACLGMSYATFFSRDSKSAYPWIAASAGIGIFERWYLFSHQKKLHRQFIEAIEVYNGKVIKHSR